MTTGLGRGFAQGLIDTMVGEHVNAFPATVGGTFRLHVGEPGPELAENVQPDSERRATLVVNDDLSGYIQVHGALQWVIMEPEGQLPRPVQLWPVQGSFESDASGARFGVALGRHGRLDLQVDDHLHLTSATIPWSVTSV